MPAYIGKYFIFAVLGILIAIITSFLITYLLVPAQTEGLQNDEKTRNTSSESTTDQECELHSVTNGTYVPLETVADSAFSAKLLGDGFAMESTTGDVFSPVCGTVSTVFPTKHAIGITTSNGLEILIHMGIDTVSLNGEGFDVFVREGDIVSLKTKLAHMNIKNKRSKEKHFYYCGYY